LLTGGGGALRDGPRPPAEEGGGLLGVITGLGDGVGGSTIAFLGRVAGVGL